METVRDFIFLGSKITADGDCSHEIKRLALWKKSYDQLRQHIIKRRHCFADKGLFTQNCGFSSSRVWMWELDHKEGWILKNWCFWTVVLEKTLESLLDCKEISPEYSLEGLMLKLKLQYFNHMMRRTDSLEKTLMLERLKAGGEGDERGQDCWMASLTQWTRVWASSETWQRTGKPGVLQSMGSPRVGRDWVTKQQQLTTVGELEQITKTLKASTSSSSFVKWQ